MAHKVWLRGLTIQVVIRTSDFQTDVNPISVFEHLYFCKTDGLMMTDMIEPYRHSTCDISTRKI